MHACTLRMRDAARGQQKQEPQWFRMQAKSDEQMLALADGFCSIDVHVLRDQQADFLRRRRQLQRAQ